MFLAFYIYSDICQNMSQRLFRDDTKLEHENFSGGSKMKKNCDGGRWYDKYGWDLPYFSDFFRKMIEICAGCG